MGFFDSIFKGKSNADGWLAINSVSDGVLAVRISRLTAGKPLLRLAQFQALEKHSVAEGLEKLCKSLRLGRSRCTTLLAQGQYQLLSVDAPNVPAPELKAAMRWRLKDMIDYPLDQATIDVLDVPVDLAAAVPKHTMLAVVARNSVIKQCQAEFLKAKITLAVIDIPDLAQRNIAALLEPEGRGLAMLSFDGTGGLLTVTCGGELYLSRLIDVSLMQLMAPDAAANCFDKITLELQRSLDHCDRQYHFIVITKLILAPLNVPALKVHLSDNIYMPVEMLDLAEIIDLTEVPEMLEIQQQQRFFLAVGAALRQQGAAP